MIYDGKYLPDGERIRTLIAMESSDRNDIGRIHAGEFDPEPRRYPPEPALDVPRGAFDDGELSLVEPVRTRLSHETILNYPLSRSLAYTRQREAQARRRALVRKGCWVAGVTALLLLAMYIVSNVAGATVLWVTA